MLTQTETSSGASMQSTHLSVFMITEVKLLSSHIQKCWNCASFDSLPSVYRYITSMATAHHKILFPVDLSATEHLLAVKKVKNMLTALSFLYTHWNCWNHPHGYCFSLLAKFDVHCFWGVGKNLSLELDYFHIGIWGTATSGGMIWFGLLSDTQARAYHMALHVLILLQSLRRSDISVVC